MRTDTKRKRQLVFDGAIFFSLFELGSCSHGFPKGLEKPAIMFRLMDGDGGGD